MLVTKGYDPFSSNLLVDLFVYVAMTRHAPRLVASSMLAVALLTSGCVGGLHADQLLVHEEKRFTVSGTPDITLVTFDGRIEIRAWDRNEVVIEIEKRGWSQEGMDDIKIVSEQTGDKVRVEARRPGRDDRHVLFHGGRSAKLIASVPRASNLMVSSGDGSIVVERVTGRIELRTSDGSVLARELSGDVRIHTGDGSIRAEDVVGRVDIDTSDGSVTVDGKLAGVKVRTGDGSVTLRAYASSVMDDDWSIRTADGTIVVDLPASFNAELDAHTGDGSVRINGVSAGEDEDDRRTVKSRLGAGGRTLMLRTGDGSIRLHQG